MSNVLKNCSLPFFPGFYGTFFDISDNLYYDAQSEYDYYLQVLGQENADKVNLSPDDFEPTNEDLNKWQEDICESFVSEFLEYVPDWVENIEFVGISRPKYYNFYNDELICNILLTSDWQEKVSDFIYDNYDNLKEDIKRDWSSRDGFHSFISNNVDEWGECIEKEPDLYLPLLLQYAICYNEGVDASDMSSKLCEYAYEDVALPMYCNNEEAEKLFRELE